MGQRRRPQNLYGQFQCPSCQQWKYPDEFYNNRRTTDGISTYCKVCQREKQKFYTPAAKRARFEERQTQALEDLQGQMVELQKRLEELQGLTSPHHEEVTQLVPDDEFDQLFDKLKGSLPDQ